MFRRRRAIVSASFSRSAWPACPLWPIGVNIGMVTGVLPVVGATPRLVSYGGSSLITVLIALGLLMNVSIRRYAY